MRKFRTVALGATLLALLVGACSSGGGSPSPCGGQCAARNERAKRTGGRVPIRSGRSRALDDAQARRAAGMPGAPVLSPRPEGNLRPRVRGVRPARRGRPADRHGADRRSGRRRPAVHLGPGDRHEQLRPPRGRQAAPARRQHRPGRPPGGPRRQPGRRRSPQHGDGAPHPGGADEPEQGGHGRRPRGDGRGHRVDHRPELRREQRRARRRHHRRLDQLLRAGDPGRDLRPDAREQRRDRGTQVPARQPRDRLPGPRSR